MKICVVGTGYVGLVTGTCFADNGNDVWCVDIDAKKIQKLNEGILPIYEPGLDQMVARNVKAERLRFQTDLADAVARARIVFLCVGTPSAEGGAPEMKYVYQAAEDVARAMKEHTIIVLKSTVPVGTAAEVRKRVAAVTKHPFDVVSNPEFLKEGHAVEDFLKPDRVVVGTNDPRVALIMKELYDPFVRSGNPILIMDNPSAELTKYGANALLAARISFMNELANLSDRVGADIDLVRQGMASDSRIGKAFLFPGIGFGGSCLRGQETVLVRRDGVARLLRLDHLFFGEGSTLRAKVDGSVTSLRPAGLEVLSWHGERGVEWRAVEALTRRRFEGEAVMVRAKLGRRVRVTPDHPFVVRDGDGGATRIKLARDLTTDDWLPLAQGRAPGEELEPRFDLLAALPGLGIPDEEVIVRPASKAFDGLKAPTVRAALERLGHHRAEGRAYDILRSGALRLSEARELGLSLEGAALGTAKNGTYVPTALQATPAFWRVLGLYLSEGHRSIDGKRHRLSWSFHPTDEQALVDEVVAFWTAHGVEPDVYHRETTCSVTISSRILSAWFIEGLGLGADCYSHAIPDAAWTLPEPHRLALLSGLWHGDGSWSRVNRGNSVVLEYGTASRTLADGMLRLLGELGVTARHKIGRTAKSTIDTHWLVVAGADQVERLIDLVKPTWQADVKASLGRLQRRSAPTGSRRFDGEPTSWLRVTAAEKAPWEGWVYSLEVPGTETFVTTAGLVVHNCFPKDVDALGHTGAAHGLDLKLLKATNDVNRAQKRVLFDKMKARLGDLKGKRIAIWGLAFKPQTDDMREAPSLTVIQLLLEAGATVHAYDPVATHTTKEVLGDKITYASKPYDALEKADALAICTEWNEFRRPDFDRIKKALRQPLIFDGRNIFEPARCEELGFEYFGIGRGRQAGAAKPAKAR